MHKGLGFFAGGLASLVIGGAQAKMVRYEICCCPLIPGQALWG